MSEALRPAAWQYTTESGDEHYTAIKARALQFDANPMPLYAAPPSTAEAQARALEDAAKKIRRFTTDTPEYNPHFIAAFLNGRAKRIREEW